jgi:hypothetical protein
MSFDTPVAIVDADRIERNLARWASRPGNGRWSSQVRSPSAKGSVSRTF